MESGGIKRRPWAIGVVVLAAVCIAGCGTPRQWRYFFSYLITKPTPDYEELEEDRAGDEVVARNDGERSSHEIPYWTSFRGPVRDGHYRERPLRLDWAERPPPLLWRRPVGEGYGSFVVADGLAYTLEQRRDEELIAAYDLDSGAEIWTHRYPARFQEILSGAGPRSTPTYHRGVVCVIGGTGLIHALDAVSGQVIWQRNILEDTAAENLTYGIAASPLIVHDRLIVLGGEPKGTAGSMAAYDLLDGRLLWTAQPEAQAYSSPVLLELAGREQIVSISATRLAGLAVDDGAILWDFPWRVVNGLNCAQPIQIDASRLVVSGGYGKGAALVEVSSGPAGLEARERWRSPRLKNRFNSSVLHDGYIYGFDEAILVCFDPETGDRVWKEGRYGYGQLLTAEGRLIVLSEYGDLALVSASPDGYRELARFKALEGKTLNVPAIAHGRLLVRNTAEMACFDLRVGQ